LGSVRCGDPRSQESEEPAKENCSRETVSMNITVDMVIIAGAMPLWLRKILFKFTQPLLSEAPKKGPSDFNFKDRRSDAN